jgi:hypothetical protein
MNQSKNRQPLGEHIHNWLIEPEGQTFRLGKWRFWLVAVIFLSVLNSILTALIFRNGDNDDYMAAIVLGAGTLIAWICVGAIHYSDSPNRQLARGVSLLDSISLLFVALHFVGLLWVYGHIRIMRNAEAKYEAAATAYNAKAEKISGDNVKIAEAGAKISDNEKERAKLDNDAAYQLRRAAEVGGVPRSAARTAPANSTIGAGLATAPIELERPEKPKQTSDAWLAEWDWAVRLANCGELLLAVITLIYIRNQTAKTNAGYAPVQGRGPTFTGPGHSVEGFARGAGGEDGPKTRPNQD